jgi:hypothetical protein
MRALFSLTGIAVLCSFVALYLVQLGSIADDPGLGWHLKTGQLIYLEKVIPERDPFLAPAVRENPLVPVGIQRPWVSDQWLGDLLLYGLYANGGWSVVYAVVVALYLVAFFGIASEGARERTVSALGLLVAVVLACKVGQVHLIVRPVIFSILFFAAVFSVVRGIAARASLSWGDTARCTLSLGVLFALWANLHPAFVLGLLLVTLLFGVSIVFRRQMALPLLCAALVSWGATLLNPWGYHLHTSIVALGQSSYFLSLNQEWHPLDMWSFEGGAFMTLAVLAAVGLLVRLSCQRGTTHVDAVMGVVFFALAIRSVRFLPFASIALIPLAAGGVSAVRLLPVPSGARLTAQVVSLAERYEATFRRAGLVSSLCFGAFFLVASIVFGERAFRHPLGPSDSTYPYRVTKALEASERQSGVVLASPNWGGTITWRLFPRFKAVIDDRNTMLGEEMYRAVDGAMREKPLFDRMVGDFGVTHAVLPVTVPVAQQLLTATQWRTLYRDADVVVFELVP